MTTKLNIPIEVVFDDLNSMIDELCKLQKYKLGEGDDMILVDVCDVADILMRHVKGRETKRGTHWIPCSGRLPENEPNYVEYEVTIERGDGTRYVTTSFWIESCGAWEWNDYGVIAWRELSEPYGGDEK